MASEEKTTEIEERDPNSEDRPDSNEKLSHRAEHIERSDFDDRTSDIEIKGELRSKRATSHDNNEFLEDLGRERSQEFGGKQISVLGDGIQVQNEILTEDTYSLNGPEFASSWDGQEYAEIHAYVHNITAANETSEIADFVGSFPSSKDGAGMGENLGRLAGDQIGKVLTRKPRGRSPGAIVTHLVLKEVVPSALKEIGGGVGSLYDNRETIVREAERIVNETERTFQYYNSPRAYLKLYY